MAYTKNVQPVGDWLANGIKTSQLNVCTTATPLPATALAGRRFILVYNVSGNTIYVGDSTVTTDNGIVVVNASSISLSLDASVILYGIAAGATNDIRVLEGA